MTPFRSPPRLLPPARPAAGRLRHRADPGAGDPHPVGAGRCAVILFSSETGWSDGDAATAGGCRRRARPSSGSTFPRYLAALDAEGKDCVYLVSDFERLSHAIERSTGASTFHAPLDRRQRGRGGARPGYPRPDPRRHARRGDRGRSCCGAAAPHGALHVRAAPAVGGRLVLRPARGPAARAPDPRRDRWGRARERRAGRRAGGRGRRLRPQGRGRPGRGGSGRRAPRRRRRRCRDGRRAGHRRAAGGGRARHHGDHDLR